jgi:hypothetical protein
MDVNGLSYTQARSVTKPNTTISTNKKSTGTAKEAGVTQPGVIYEQSDSQTAIPGLYTPNTKLVNQLKADMDDRLTQMQDLVYKLISKQGNTALDVDSIWSLLQKGEITVDQETADAAKQEISEDGYWGVNQTSDRIISFAKALTGGDPSKIDAMQEAFQKGYEEATKAWGSDLPEISSKTYDAVMEKFEAWRKETEASADTNDIEAVE